MLFTGLPIDAPEAARIGLIDLIGGVDAAGALIAAMLDNAAESLAVLKRGIRLAEQGIDRDEGQDAAFERLFGSEDLAARLEARKR